MTDTSMQPVRSMARDVREKPRLTPSQIAKLAPQEKQALHINTAVAMLRSIEAKVTQALVDAVQNGCELEGHFVARPAIEDIVPLVISVKSAYLPSSVRATWNSRDQNVGFVLRDRKTLSRELSAARLAPGVEIGGGSRAERRAIAGQIDKHPWALLGETLRDRLFPGVPGCYWAVILCDQILGHILPFRFDAVEMQAALAEAKAIREAREAERAAFEANENDVTADNVPAETPERPGAASDDGDPVA